MGRHSEIFQGYEIEGLKRGDLWRIRIWPARSDSPPMSAGQRIFDALTWKEGFIEARQVIARHVGRRLRNQQSSLHHFAMYH